MPQDHEEFCDRGCARRYGFGKLSGGPMGLRHEAACTKICTTNQLKPWQTLEIPRIAGADEGTRTPTPFGTGT
jgi:hypothetical protein